jgi:hypothetical protein
MMEQDETYDGKVGKLREDSKRQGYGVGISNMPKWLWREFIEDAKENFSDCYWAKLLDMRNKAISFEMLQMQGYIQPQGQEQSAEDDYDEEEDSGVYTFTGKVN